MNPFFLTLSISSISSSSCVDHRGMRGMGKMCSFYFSVFPGGKTSISYFISLNETIWWWGSVEAYYYCCKSGHMIYLLAMTALNCPFQFKAWALKLLIQLVFLFPKEIHL